VLVNDFTLSRMTVEDARALVAVTQSVGWPHTVDDWQTVLASGTTFGHRAPDGQVVASAAIFPHGPALASIGMVIVTPPYQGRGLARALMRRCLAHLPPPAPPSMLIATAAGFPVYRRLGFKTVDHVRKLAAPARARTPMSSPRTRRDVSAMAAGDLESAQRLDGDATGADRRVMLRARLAQGSGALMRDGTDSPVGFGLATRQGDVLVVGPVIAPDADSAARLVAHLAAHHGGPMRIDIPARQVGLLARLADQGFEGTDEAPVMVLGADGLPGRRDQIFAAATLAFG
jgi:GNAT superfamily N-acetyltransferase